MVALSLWGVVVSLLESLGDTTLLLLLAQSALAVSVIESGAALVACKEYPHIDYAARGEELHALHGAMVRGELRMKAHFKRVPLLGIFGTTVAPMSDFVARLKDSEARLPGTLSVSVLHGFPWADTPHTCAAVLVLAEDSPAAAGVASGLLEELAEAFYGIRETAAAKRLPLKDALD